VEKHIYGGPVTRFRFPAYGPAMPEKQNSLLSETIKTAAIQKCGMGGYRCDSAEYGLFAIIIVMKPTD
jgi:hypothetical protein